MGKEEMMTETLRADIVETARLLFDTKGFDKTTIEDLIARLGIGENLLFRHFQSMDEILEVVWSGS